MQRPNTSNSKNNSKPNNSKRSTRTITPKLKQRSADTLAKHLDMLKQSRDYDVCLLGDSLTEHWLDVGLPVWHQSALSKLKIFNAGVGGDMTQHVLWRLEQGFFANFKPRLVVLLIGANNLKDDNASEIVEGIKAICTRVAQDISGVKLAVCSVLPLLDAPCYAKVKLINPLLEALSKSPAPGTATFVYHDFAKLFVDAAGQPDAQYFADHIHLNGAGYGVWAAPLLELIECTLPPTPTNTACQKRSI